MCGIFGFAFTKNCNDRKIFFPVFKELFLLSESRGKEASGMALNNGRKIRFLKTPFPASELVKSAVFKKETNSFLHDSAEFYCAIGHSRLVTNGYEHDNINNQPVVKNKIISVHNGIIVNQKKIWEKYSDEKRISDLDSELIPTLLNRFISSENNILTATKKLYSEIYGMTSTANLFAEYPALLLATNNGSLYCLFNEERNAFVFASEKHILNALIENLSLKIFQFKNIFQLNPQNHLLINLNTFQYSSGNFLETAGLKIDKTNEPVIEEINERVSAKPIHINRSMEHRVVSVSSKFENTIETRKQKILLLKRCTKCILPETFPFIEFDEKGICNYCNNYHPLKYDGVEIFKKTLEKFKSNATKNHDCLIPFSGGRDSSFALHFVKKEMGMKPIAFSYDWGMLTDLARRNQARMCGKLGVEHILVSADIRKKRDNIRKNVLAWLKKPHLGTIPLFMAGDKQYFYFANLLMEQNDLELSIMGENMLETTRFKTGFCGIKPRFDSQHTYSLQTTDKLKMLFFYGKEYLLNPAYINASLLDTLDAFKSYYVMKHQNINLFSYMPWDENEIETTLINEYDWETDPGTKTTWRIGDGTAAFYNYIYFMVAGFTENDTFRSNQIREGLITRETALEKTNEENEPRWDSIQWYCNTIGIDWEGAVKRINEIESGVLKRHFP